MSDSIIERLRHHAQDERNTAFARSTMREAITELDEWGKLRDPAVLHASLCRGMPAQLDRGALLHCAGVEQLRAELTAGREREAWMRAMIADDGHAMTFQSLGQYRTSLLRALAERAQG